MDYNDWIKKVSDCLVGMGHNYPIDEQSFEFKEDFEQGLTPEESAQIAFDDFYN